MDRLIQLNYMPTYSSLLRMDYLGYLSPGQYLDLVHWLYLYP
jgi:hypothetical protein